jgi:hypothetical protein
MAFSSAGQAMLGPHFFVAISRLLRHAFLATSDFYNSGADGRFSTENDAIDRLDRLLRK